ncbi:ATP-binding cassette domain-containing protein [Streptomyces sp. NPDC020801]|uniref:ATP-binding cassette domain-containing protein n=1 Tax=unclassified Streptomyces TaxID=2593676 RepID=UPI00379A0DED
MLRVIQAFGLTSDSRKDLPPAVDDVSFEAHAGRVTALLGAAGAGKTTTLRLMLELQQGRGITYFKGRPLHRIAHPSREVGVLLGDVPGHPSRTVRGHLRMLCAAAGLPVRRADEVLEVVGLVSLREERLGTLSRGMDRRLGLACVLLSDPHTLVLDDPAGGLSARESRWLHGMLRAHTAQGGTVLFATADPKEAARTADRVVTIDTGRLVADQEAADFARHRLRPRVAVRSPHAARLAALLAKEARTARRSVEVVREDGNRLSVYGSTCADIGEAAFRHGIPVHQLADEVGDMGPGAGSTPSAGTNTVEEPRASGVPAAPEERQAPTGTSAAGRRESTVDRRLADTHASGDGTPHGAPLREPTAAPAAAVTTKAAAQSEPAADSMVAPAHAAPAAGAASRAADIKATSGLEAPRRVTARLGDALVTHASDAPSVTAVSGDASVTTGPEGASVTTTPESASFTAQSTGESTRADTLNRSAAATTHPATTRHPATAQSSTRTATSHPAAAHTPATHPTTSHSSAPHPSIPTPRPAEAVTLDASSPLPPCISVRPGPSPLRPLRYELRRAAGIGTGFATGAAVLVVGVLTALVMGRLGHTPQPRLLAAWPQQLPLPPAALGAGLLGALAFGDEFRHPALAADRGTVPRRLGLLTAKLLVTAATALMLAFLAVGCDAEGLYVVYGRELAQVPGDWLPLGASWAGLVVGCAWTGVLAAGLFRSTTAGLAAVVAVPVAVVPLVQKAWGGAVWSATDLPARLHRTLLLQWPFGGDHYLAAAARVITQPLGGALALSLTALLCAYLLTTLRSRVR